MLLTGFVVIAERSREPIVSSYAERPDLGKRLLSRGTHGAIRVVLLGSIHQRARLVERLRASCEPRALEGCQASDAALIALLVHRFGSRALEELEGEFSLICHDVAAKRLVALRDPLGAYPLFWSEQRGTFAIGTSIRALLPWAPSHEVDSDYIARYLAFPTDAISELPATSSACRGVQRLLPGFRLDVDLPSGNHSTAPYFDWSRRLDVSPADSLEAAGTQVRAELERAVRERLSRTGSTASHFSGGLDSTGIALLADRLSAPRGSLVHGLSLVFRDDPSLHVERDYIECALAQNPRVVPHFIEADELLDFSENDCLPVFDEPTPAIARFGLMAAMVNVASQAGADTVLGGDGADHLFARDATALIEERLAAGELGEAWKLVRRTSYASSRSALSISGSVLQSFTSSRLGKLPRRAARRVPFESMTGSDVPTWFDPAYVQRHRLDSQHAFARDTLGGDLTLGVVRTAAGNWYNWHVGMPRGVLMQRPFWDARLVKLALELPQSLHVQPGTMKPVLHAALRDVLPRKLLSRRLKSHFGILNLGFGRYRKHLLRLINDAPLPFEMLDRASLSDAVEKAALGLYTDARCVGRLRLALGYLDWISRRDSWLKNPFPVALRREFTTTAEEEPC